MSSSGKDVYTTAVTYAYIRTNYLIREWAAICSEISPSMAKISHNAMVDAMVECRAYKFLTLYIPSSSGIGSHRGGRISCDIRRLSVEDVSWSRQFCCVSIPSAWLWILTMTTG